MAKILVVEDDVNMNEILVSTLEGEDHELTSAFNGEKAIELCQSESFELVITDVRLPGMDGVETLSGIRKLQGKIKTIVITGYASADTPVRAMGLKVDDYLFKPFSLKYLLRSVNRVLDDQARRKKRWSLFQKVYSILGPSPDRQLERLVLQRHEAFQSLYIGTRSKYLTPKAALEVYIKLELLEKRFRNILNADEFSSKDAKFLQARYLDLQGRIGEFKSGEAEEAPNEGLITREEFRHLYEAIQNSEIGVEELQYAPLLREAPEERFETLKEMLEIKRKLWPQSIGESD